MRYTITKCWNTPEVKQAVENLRRPGLRIRKRGRGPRQRWQHQALPLTEAVYFTAYIEPVTVNNYHYDICRNCWRGSGEVGETCGTCGRGVMERHYARDERLTEYEIKGRLQFVRLQKDGKLRLRYLNQ